MCNFYEKNDAKNLNGTKKALFMQNIILFSLYFEI